MFQNVLKYEMFVIYLHYQQRTNYLKQLKNYQNEKFSKKVHRATII